MVLWAFSFPQLFFERLSFRNLGSRYIQKLAKTKKRAMRLQKGEARDWMLWCSLFIFQPTLAKDQAS